MDMDPGDIILHAHKEHGTVFLVTAHGNVWAVCLDHEGMPLIEMHMCKGEKLPNELVRPDDHSSIEPVKA